MLRDFRHGFPNTRPSYPLSNLFLTIVTPPNLGGLSNVTNLRTYVLVYSILVDAWELLYITQAMQQIHALRDRVRIVKK